MIRKCNSFKLRNHFTTFFFSIIYPFSASGKETVGRGIVLLPLIIIGEYSCQRQTCAGSVLSRNLKKTCKLGPKLLLLMCCHILSPSLTYLKWNSAKLKIFLSISRHFGAISLSQKSSSILIRRIVLTWIDHFHSFFVSGVGVFSRKVYRQTKTLLWNVTKWGLFLT